MEIYLILFYTIVVCLFIYIYFYIKDMDLIIKHVSGGRLHWKKTGIYQDNIVFYSEKYNGSWRCEFEKVPYKGFLKIQDKTIFNYTYHNTFFEVQEVFENGTLSNWQEVKINRIFCD